MSIFEKSRFEIWNQTQHPFKHTLADFSYSNPALPGVTNVEGAMAWILAVLYPNAKAAVANPAALPLLANTLNDYRVVLDDGDGKSASYRWEQREGEVSPSWHKVMDMDWSTDSILASFMDVSQDLFVIKRGRQDLDAAGAIVTGTYAGQAIYGGTQANQNLTLFANSGDGVGPKTGFVQTEDHFRPTVDAALDLGTAANKFRSGYLSLSLAIDTLTLTSGSIVDSTGALNFGSCDLFTLGEFTGLKGFFSSSVEIGSFVGNALILGPGSVTDESGIIDFGVTALQGTGALDFSFLTLVQGLNVLIFNPDSSGVGEILHSSGIISFGAMDLSGTGDLGFANGAFSASVAGGNLGLSGNTLSSQNANGNIIILPNGTGIVDIQKSLQTLGISATGTVGVVGQLNADNLRLDGNTLSATNVNGSIVLSPNGTGNLQVTASIVPQNDVTHSLGQAAFRFTSLFLNTSISDGTDSISMSTLLSFRDASLGAAAGDTLFWDGTQWLPSAPDSEITHGGLSGLSSDDHTQYLLLAGRGSGQTAIGGLAASEDLILQSTAHATRGFIKVADSLAPLATASYSGGWSGKDLGSASLYFRNLYTKGELIGARLENLTVATLPSPSAQNVGRMVFATDVNKAYVDTGIAFKVLGVSKYAADTTWDGVITTLDVNVSSEITDARTAIWGLFDNANDFERIYCSLKSISATTVRITVSPALPAGSYRLIGIE